MTLARYKSFCTKYYITRVKSEIKTAMLDGRGCSCVCRMKCNLHRPCTSLRTCNARIRELDATSVYKILYFITGRSSRSRGRRLLWTTRRRRTDFHSLAALSNPTRMDRSKRVGVFLFEIFLYRNLCVHNGFLYDAYTRSH